ncbi:MAG TPA: hypothetical protein VGI82_06875 [Chitinophagaceae bacterium]
MKALTVILAVAAPSLVTYQTNQSNKAWGIVTIFLVAIASTATALQSIFNFGGKFSIETLTFLNIDELESGN